MGAERDLPHGQARSRGYRWGEDGLAGFCDEVVGPISQQNRT
jgi:hypothetical protein